MNQLKCWATGSSEMIFEHHINHFLYQILGSLQKNSMAAGFLLKQYQK